MNTKEKIIDTAINLFNDKSTKAVTTNHIAVEAGISPGNLYYHFRNKEEIIRNIYQRMIAFMDDAWTIEPNDLPTFFTLEKMLKKVFQLQYDYRFFHYEMTSLLNRDPELKIMYSTIQKKRKPEIIQFMFWLAEGGIVSTDIDMITMTNLVEITWLISNFWLSQCKLTGETFDDKQIHRGISLTIQLFKPYLTPEGKQAFQAFLFGRNIDQ